MNRKKRVDPVPDEFPSYEAAAEFWDTHDTTDYPEIFRTVKVVTEFRGRYYDIEIEPDVVRLLQKQARRKSVTVSHLASELLREQLAQCR